jgi:hypothetical protein
VATGSKVSVALAVLTLVSAGAARLDGIYVRMETERVPVARLVANLEQRLAASPKDSALHVKLARLYGMAYALNTDVVPASTRPGGIQEPWFGHEPLLAPVKPVPGTTRTEAVRGYLQKAVSHYQTALALEPEGLMARLGYAWALEQSGDRNGAVREYRLVVAGAWPKEQKARSGGVGERFYTQEAGEALIPLLDPAADAAEIADLQSRVGQLARVPRAITPIAIPLVDHASPRDLVDLDARVFFDADGTGQRRQWTWITPAAGWLIYDATGNRQVTSALQWFGQVTFWLFWNHGYEPLSALDDDRNGELTGAELRYLAVWHDANSNGLSEPGEVRPLAEHGISGLSCRFTAANGRLIAAMSASGVRLRDGRTRPSYDVVLRQARSVS